MNGKKLKIQRIKKDLNQKELAKLSSVNINIIGKIENYGIENVTVSTLRKISKALDTTMEELFFSEQN